MKKIPTQSFNSFWMKDSINKENGGNSTSEMLLHVTLLIQIGIMRNVSTYWQECLRVSCLRRGPGKILVTIKA